MKMKGNMDTTEGESSEQEQKGEPLWFKCQKAVSESPVADQQVQSPMASSSHSA